MTTPETVGLSRVRLQKLDQVMSDRYVGGGQGAPAGEVDLRAQ